MSENMTVKSLHNPDKTIKCVVCRLAPATCAVSWSSGKKMNLCTAHKRQAESVEAARVKRERAIVNRRHTL